MTELMNGICKIPNGGVELTRIPRPEKALPEHLLIRMEYAAISHGDKAFINRPLPPGSATSLHDVYGSSGVGEVIGVGEDVPKEYLGKHVAIFRSLHNTDVTIGSWSDYTHMHHLCCVIIPDNAKSEEFAGSLSNIITAYAFRMQSLAEGNIGIISTAGTSTTGIMMLGIALALQFPLISIVRNEEGKQLLKGLGATYVLAQDEPDFNNQLKETALKLNATAIYDGVGGAALNKIIDLVPNDSMIYSYGLLGDDTPLHVFMRQILFRGLTIKSFSTNRSQTLRDPKQLSLALKLIPDIIDMPHFKTKVGKKFKLYEIDDALAYTPTGIGKAILTFNN
jgi:NADPH:quinone reductase-like Zn-dependent oxidoreductase